MVTRGALEYPRRWCYVPCPTDRLDSFWWPSMADGELRDDRQRRTLPRADVPKVISHSLAFVRGIGEAGDDETHSGSGTARISWCYGALPHRRGRSEKVAAVGIVSPCFRRVRVERLRWESRDAGNRREQVVRGPLRVNRTEETKKSVRRRGAVLLREGGRR